MKHRLTLKFALAYVIFGIIGFCILAFWGSRAFKRAALANAAEELYASVRNVSSIQSAGYTNTGSYDPSYLSRLDSVAGYRVLLLNTEGTVVYDSSTTLTGMTVPFDPADEPEYYRSGDFYGAFREPMLSVFSPITGNMTNYGYATLHMPLSAVYSRADRMLGSAYLLFAAIFLSSLLVLVVSHFIVTRPLRAITDGAQEFARGNLSHRISVSSHDEMGYLASTLNTMAEDLSTANDYQKKFIANVSHDFRSPLTSIKGYLQAMLDGVIPADKQEKYIQIIISETDRLTNLTQSMLSLNSLDDARLKLELSDFDLAALVKTVCRTYEGTCTARNLLFDLVFPRPEVFVHADMGRIQQAIYNLVDNAIKFSPDGSTIRIRIYEVGNKIALSVKDYGIGISKEDLGKIWTRFYKTDASRGKDKKGTGLGLPIVKEIITAHGETVDVTSTPGSGTEFIFRLPAAEKP